jgi:hypothetical protein
MGASTSWQPQGLYRDCFTFLNIVDECETGFVEFCLVGLVVDWLFEIFSLLIVQIWL